MLTVDTHFPSGYLCEKCKVLDSDATPVEVYQEVLSCADRQFGDFMQWCEEQPWYEDTVIVIMGDHLFMDVDRTSIFPYDIAQSDKMSQRYWYNAIINSTETPTQERIQNRKFSSFDMMPTILVSMGVEFDGDGLALGRSLYSDSPTMLEKYGVDYVNTEIQVRTVEYEHFIGDEPQTSKQSQKKN